MLPRENKMATIGIKEHVKDYFNNDFRNIQEINKSMMEAEGERLWKGTLCVEDHPPYFPSLVKIHFDCRTGCPNKTNYPFLQCL